MSDRSSSCRDVPPIRRFELVERAPAEVVDPEAATDEVTASAILSGLPHTGQSADAQQNWSCDSGSSMPAECWANLNNYLSCLVDGR